MAAMLACAVAALAPAAAKAASNINITPSFPSTVAVGDTGRAGEVIITNANTAPDGSTTICNFNDTGDCSGTAGITLIPSCSVPSSTGCAAGGADPGVFSVSPTATGTAGSACAGTTFNVAVSNATFGSLRFTPTTGNVTLPANGSSCHIAFTFSVLKLPADAQAATGLQTRPRASADAVSDQGEPTFSVGSGTVTVKLAAPSVTATNPASPANNNAPAISGTAPAGTSLVTLYDNANCTGATTTGSAASFNAGGIAFSVPDDSTTTFSATVTDSAGGVSACSSSTVTYVEDSTPPPVPTITDTNPPSPANNNSPRVQGTAAAGSTVRIYTNATCTSAVAVTGSASDFASPGLLLSVADNTTTTLHATATDSAGNASACSAVLIYVEDSLPPGQPTPTGTNPPSPGNDNTPQIIGSAPAGTTVMLFTNPACTGPPVGAGSAGTFGTSGIEATVADNSTTVFYARATDQAGNMSPCSIGLTYVEDSIPPSAATVGGSSPPSPANNNSPRITGTAPADTTVRLYTDAACAGGVVGQGTAATYATPGIAVSVGDNSTTTFYAQSVDAAGNPSDCSASSVTYVEDSVAPQTSIGSGPSGSGASATPTFTFSSSEPGVTFECRLDAGNFVPCTSPFTTPPLGEGAHTFEVRARDTAGNVGTSVRREFTVGGAVSPPPPPGVTPPPPPPGPGTRAQPGCVGITGRVYVGTSRRNVRNGSNATDIMFGLGGNDALRGAGGVDCLYGGAGNDLLRGGSGADRLFGGTGNDRLEGLSGNDILSGSSGNDRLNGGTGNDRLTAGAGRDTLIDRRGTDRFSGGSGNDFIDARDSTAADRRKPDRILCGPGVDRVLADPRDIVARDCERSRVTRRSLRTIAPR